MAQRPRLADLKRICPQELSHCEGYTWHLGSKIGKGSFGEVYLGWDKTGTAEVAVKVVRREFFKQDPKVRENLDREIRILKLLRGCEYVVQLFHVQEMKHYIVLVMELCEYDLDHLVKVAPFKEDEIIIFLHQLAKGMKALREQNIVHRDLKPGNILIKHHPHTKKMMIKLADFGFARHFKDEGMKPIDMTSLAGTPVFMAPEALSCVFHPGKHYDDKVDIWSIGALLYKVIVGQCGFYAQLQDIPRILKHKGDALAFERVPHSRKINYINELPPSVNSRFSEPFRMKMNELLKEMLKLDPVERMTFPQFFDWVDDIITSKIEIVNLLHGTSYKIINDPDLTAEDIVGAASAEYHLPSKFLILFSMKSPYFISGGAFLSQQQFAELLDKAGASEGHALLYLLPITQLSPDKVTSDYSCLAPLKNELNDTNTFVTLIAEHKFSEEIAGMIKLMQSQQKKQLEGIEEFRQFCARESSNCSKNVYRQFMDLGHQALAKAAMAAQWLQDDLNSLSSKASKSQLTTLLSAVNQRREMISQIMADGVNFGSSSLPTVSVDLKMDDLDRRSVLLADEARKISRLTRDQIIKVGNGIKEDCQKQIDEVTAKVKDVLNPLYLHLHDVWGMTQKLGILQNHYGQLEQLLNKIAEERRLVLKSLSTGTPVGEAYQQRAPPTAAGAAGTPPVVVSPPVGWPQPPPPTSPANSYYNNSTVAGGPGMELDSLRREKADLSSKLTSKNQEVERLTAQLSTLKGQLATRNRNSGSGSDEMEKTIVAGAMTPTNGRLSPSAALEGHSLAPPDQKLLQELTHKLNQFCLTADKLPGVGGVTQEQVPKETSAVMSPGGMGTLYPDLLDYTIISMPDRGRAPPTSSISTTQDLQTLIPQAKQLSELLQVNVSALESMVLKSAKGTMTVSNNHALIKIGRPTEYEEGDIVLFHPVRLQRSKSTAPVVLHLEKPKPYIFMDHSSFPTFNIRPGRIPELFLGRLVEKPRLLNFEKFPDVALDVQEKSGTFYRVKAEPTELKFSVPSRPPPPAIPAPQAGKTRSGSSSSNDGGKTKFGLFHHKHADSSKRGFV